MTSLSVLKLLPTSAPPTFSQAKEPPTFTSGLLLGQPASSIL